MHHSGTMSFRTLCVQAHYSGHFWLSPPERFMWPTYLERSRPVCLCTVCLAKPKPSSFDQDNANAMPREEDILFSGSRVFFVFKSLLAVLMLQYLSYRYRIHTVYFYVRILWKSVAPFLRFKRPEPFCLVMPTSRSRRPRWNCGCLNSSHGSGSVGGAVSAPPAAAPPLEDVGHDDTPLFTFLKPGVFFM